MAGFTDKRKLFISMLLLEGGGQLRTPVLFFLTLNIQGGARRDKNDGMLEYRLPAHRAYASEREQHDRAIPEKIVGRQLRTLDVPHDVRS